MGPKSLIGKVMNYDNDLKRILKDYTKGKYGFLC